VVIPTPSLGQGQVRTTRLATTTPSLD
jgi:hypothetical protein